MGKFLKRILLSALFIGVGSLSTVEARETKRPLISRQFLKCQTNLEQFRIRLEEKSKGSSNQPYYDSLYQQTEGFLNTAKNIPISSAQLNRCESLLTALQEIVGKHATSEDASLASMPTYQRQRGGKLSAPVLETTPRRPLRKKRIERNHIEYVDYDPSSKPKGEGNEELDELERFQHPASSPMKMLRKKRSGESGVFNEFE